MHHPLTSEVLSRFHRTLVEEIRSHRPEYLTRPFTVAEIYQDLVPYRTHRDRIGVEMNGDYEDALLRLLAGEGDYLVMESDHARRELQDELESSNPNTGLFREYAAADVHLNPSRLPASLTGEDMEDGRPSPNDLFGDSVVLDFSEEDATDTPPVEELAPAPSPPEAPSDPGPAAAVPGAGVMPGPEPLPPLPDPTEIASQVAPGTPPANCRWCSEPLPRRENLNYCPFCGADAHLVPCPNCGEELEPEWRFCIACGTEASGGG